MNFLLIIKSSLFLRFFSAKPGFFCNFSFLFLQKSQLPFIIVDSKKISRFFCRKSCKKQEKRRNGPQLRRVGTDFMDIIAEINKRHGEFSKGQRRIADYILVHSDKAAFMTAAKLGATVGVSESTVVRFAYELGFEGYPELSRALQQIIRTQLTSVQRIEVTKDRIGSDDILDKVLSFDMDKIKHTLEETSRESFESAAVAIANAKNIYVIGDRSASALARFMHYYFNLMFENVKLVTTTSQSELFEQIIRVGQDDAVIGISFPRYSNMTVQAFSYAARTGAKIIAITDGAGSPLAKDATYLLTARSDMNSFVDSLVAPLSLINALIVRVGMEKQDEVTATFNRLETIWSDYHVYQTPDTASGKEQP